jgi:tripartite-type tricarboxylate transporter receptor subunit TctC
MDPVGRLVGDAITQKFGQQVIMDYRSGANGTIGTAAAAKAPPDGYTLLINPSATMINPKYMMKDLAYDSLRDFVPISKIVETPLVIIANTDRVKARTLKELVDFAKANPEKISAANVGVGSGGHLTAALLERLAGIKLTHVAYKGTGQMMADLTGGQVDLTINFFAGFGPMVDAGKLRVLAVLAKDNIPDLLKNYQTTPQAGYPELLSTGSFALYLPAGAPVDIVNKIRDTVTEYFKTPAVSAKLAELGYVVTSTSTAELTQALKNEDAKWGPIFRAVGLTPQ